MTEPLLMLSAVEEVPRRTFLHDALRRFFEDRSLFV
jgi:hypothetical protein